MKTILRAISCTFLLSVLSIHLCAQQSTYEVEIAAYNTYVPMDYFDGLSGISYYKDANDIHRYRIKMISSLDDAKAKMQKAKAKGFNARIINVAEERALLAQCEQKLDHIFFEFDQSRLTYNSKEKLDNLAATLKSNGDLQAILAGHTDGKGSNEYNEALSRARVQEAMAYLLSQNVRSDQISTKFFGENAPIAKNTLDGNQDLPSGRKFNRRVEIQIVNTANKKMLSELVRKINVPSELKY